MTESVIILQNVTLRFPKLKGILSIIKDKITKKDIRIAKFLFI